MENWDTIAYVVMFQISLYCVTGHGSNKKSHIVILKMCQRWGGELAGNAEASRALFFPGDKYMPMFFVLLINIRMRFFQDV
jgi:hypothetical protein